MTGPQLSTGYQQAAGPRGARNARHNSNCDAMQSALNLSLGNSISFPPGPHGLSTRALLKKGYFSQALIDVGAVLFLFIGFIILMISLPLAVALMILGAR